MVRHHFAPVIWGHLCQPLFIGFSQALFEVLLALLKISLICRIQRAKLCRNALGNASTVVWIQPIVRISHRMYVTLSAGYIALGNLQNFRELRSVKIARA